VPLHARHPCAREPRLVAEHQLNLKVLYQHSALSDPMGEVSTTPRSSSLDLNAVIKDRML
jgi:catalase (peroxidase I)